MRHARGTKGKCEWAELHVAVAVLLAIIAAKEQAEEGQFMRMRRQFARLRMAQFGKDGSADGLLTEHAAVKLAAGQPLLTARNLHRCCHCPPSHSVEFVQDRGT